MAKPIHGGPPPGWSGDRPMEAVQQALEALEKRMGEVVAELGQIDFVMALFDEVFQELLVTQPPESGLYTPFALHFLRERIKRIEDALENMVRMHRNVHGSVSKIGKEINRHFIPSTKGLIRNEKDLEADPKCARNVQNLIVNYLMGTGNVEIAEMYVKECNLHGRLDEYQSFKQHLTSVMESFRNRNSVPAANFLQKHYPDEKRLIFELIRVQVIRLIKEGRKLEAVRLSQRLPGLGADGELAEIMGVIMLNPDDDKFKDCLSPVVWDRLERRLSEVIFKSRVNLPGIISMGVRALPQLLHVKVIMSMRQEQIFSSDELPIEIPIKERMHSTFTCPILRCQATEKNPPHRLSCGHVISLEALERLAANARQYRFKCPYCPIESAKSEAARVYF
ncbi:unnamed protein product, partial [Mesorhabditis spiculigera]